MGLRGEGVGDREEEESPEARSGQGHTIGQQPCLSSEAH